MQLVIERARYHFQTSSRLLIQRPVAGIESIQIMNQRLDPAIEDRLRGSIGARQPEIEHAPQRPHESVQNVRRWIDEILFDPEVLLFVLKKDTTLGDGLGERNERLFSRALILILILLVFRMRTRMSMRPQKK